MAVAFYTMRLAVGFQIYVIDFFLYFGNFSFIAFPVGIVVFEILNGMRIQCLV
jgi:hypothetical protein